MARQNEGQGKSKNISIRISPDLFKSLQESRAEFNLDISGTVRIILEIMPTDLFREYKEIGAKLKNKNKRIKNLETVIKDSIAEAVREGNAILKQLENSKSK
ncbi:MAG: hypothetical protein M1276_05340 [Deltaproteobacteria bacterium]|nr:hypothetical protein [Deltaproteobacteria bacterium]